MKKGSSFNRFGVWATVFSLLLAISIDAGATFFEKKYLVQKLDGKDVLCDAYMVKKNDYVTLLLKQRGEIAYEDFPAFLEIFARLNPHVPDVNTIYPGQRIMIPLKILAPGSVPGQSSGAVTMPVITITNLPETLKQHSQEYKVQYGDWVSKLISERFGADRESFKRGMELFMQLNPDIQNVDKIREGQTIRLPDPSIRDTPVYAGIAQPGAAAEKPEPGTIKVEENNEPAPIASDKSQKLPIPGKKSDLSAATPPPTDQNKKHINIPAAVTPERADRLAVVAPVPKPAGFSDKSVFRKAAAIFDAKLMDKGEYFFPRPGTEDFRLVLTETPLMVFDGGKKIIFTKKGWLSEADQKVIESKWPGLRIVTYEMNSGLRPLAESIVPVIDSDGFENHIVINDHGITMTVRGQYIYDSPDGTGKICLNIIDDPGLRVPGTIRYYLQTQGITVRDWVEGKAGSGFTGQSYPVRNPEAGALAIDPASFLIERLVGALGYAYQKDIEISFPYAGFQVKALVHMLSCGGQEEVLLDYGDLGGDAVSSIEKTGFRVLQIKNGSGLGDIVEKLSPIMPAEVTADPLFWTSRRPRIYNPSFQIPGYLIMARQENRTRRVLITTIPVPQSIAAYLAETGVLLMRVRE